ncbi:MAG: SpoIVB peptidase [Bacillota bacterium]
MPRNLRSFVVLFFLSVLFTSTYIAAAFWPVRQSLAVGEVLRISESVPDFLRDHLVLTTDDSYPGFGNCISLLDEVKVAAPGRFQARLAIHGVIPIRTIVFDVQPVLRVYPGGQAVGVLLHTQGVIVVGYAEVVHKGGTKSSPAAEAGLMVGDIIVSIDGKPAANDQVVKEAVLRAGGKGRPVFLEVERRGKTIRFKVRPALCRRSESYRIGLLIRDSAAGVGTLTFYEPATRTYGALGHVITDVTTNNPVELAEGSIIEAFIQGIRPGQKGKPGEKLGIISQASTLSGTIQHNTEYGIFGRLDRIPQHPFYKKPIPVALAHQVRPGPATILTVVKGSRMEQFQIEIVRTNPLSRGGKKDIIINVTDRRLLRSAGGIIQGMSGSPIIQSGRLVGAVTHVYISNPQKGYGIFAERMLRECNLLSLKNKPEVFLGDIGYYSTKACCKI